MLDDMTDDAVVAEIGRRVSAHRIALSLTQTEFAERAGVGRSTVQRIEAGDSIQLLSLVKILRALERIEGLDALLSPRVRSPLLDLEQERRLEAMRPRRVRRSKAEQEPKEGQPEPWTWGEQDEKAGDDGSGG